MIFLSQKSKKLLSFIHTKTLQGQIEEDLGLGTDQVENVRDHDSGALDKKCYKNMQRCLQITGNVLSDIN